MATAVKGCFSMVFRNASQRNRRSGRRYRRLGHGRSWAASDTSPACLLASRTARLKSVFGGSDISMLRGCERLSTFVLDFSAFFAAFLAAFTAFLATFAAFFALLVFLAIFAVLQLWLRDRGPHCASVKDPRFLKSRFFSLNHFRLWLRISRHQDRGPGAPDQPAFNAARWSPGNGDVGASRPSLIFYSSPFCPAKVILSKACTYTV